MEGTLLVKYPETKLTICFGLRISIIKLKNTLSKQHSLNNGKFQNRTALWNSLV